MIINTCTVEAASVGDGEALLTDTGVPSPPLNVTVTSDAEGLWINWSEPASIGGSEIQNYIVRIFAGDPSNYLYGMQISFGEGTTLSTHVETRPGWGNLSGGETYLIRIAAVNMYGESESSAEVSITSNFGPDKPENIAIMPGDGYLNLTWSAPLKDGGRPVLAYDIQRYRYNETYYPFDWHNSSVSAEINGLNDTGLLNGVEYCYYIKARNEVGQGWTYHLSAFPGNPLPPQNMNYSKWNGFVNISWSPPLADGGFPITNYSVYRNDILIASISVLATSYNDTSAENGQYYYYVRAANSIGESVNSEYAYVQMPTMPTPPGRMWPIFPLTGNGYVDLLWWPLNDGGSAIIEYKIVRYRLNASDGHAFDWNNLTVAPNTTTYYGMEFSHYNDTSVTNGVEYHYNISAVNVVGVGEWESTKVTVALPSAPYGIQWAETGSNYVNMSWDPPMQTGGFPIIGYNIYRNSTFLTMVPANATFFRDYSLVNNVEYAYYVTAVNAIGESPGTDTINLMSVLFPPPVQFVSAIIGNGYVNVTWTSPDDLSNVKGYLVERYPQAGGYGYSAMVDAPVTYYHDTIDLIPGTVYVYAVTTVSLENVRANQHWTALVTIPNPPSSPLNLSFKAVIGYVDLTWSPPEDDGGSPIVAYVLYRGLNSSSMAPFANISATSSMFNDTSVIEGMEYYYKVVAVNGLWEGLASDIINVAFSLVPGVPTGLTITPGDGRLELVWSAPNLSSSSPITNYRIYRGYTLGSLTFLTNVTGTSFVDTNVTSEHVYYYKVSATNTAGWGPNSSSVNATPTSVAPAPPGVPTNLQVKAGDGSVHLSWMAPLNNGSVALSGYMIYRGTSLASMTLLDTVTATNYTDTGLSNGQTYYYRVLAYSSVGNGTTTDLLDVKPIGGGDDNTLLYIAMGAIAVVGVAGVASFFMLRRRK